MVEDQAEAESRATGREARASEAYPACRDSDRGEKGSTKRPRVTQESTSSGAIRARDALETGDGVHRYGGALIICGEGIGRSACSPAAPASARGMRVLGVQHRVGGAPPFGGPAAAAADPRGAEGSAAPARRAAGRVGMSEEAAPSFLIALAVLDLLAEAAPAAAPADRRRPPLARRVERRGPRVRRAAAELRPILLLAGIRFGFSTAVQGHRPAGAPARPARRRGGEGGARCLAPGLAPALRDHL